MIQPPPADRSTVILFLLLLIFTANPDLVGRGGWDGIKNCLYFKMPNALSQVTPKSYLNLLNYN